MRALLFDAFNQVIREIVLPVETAILYQQIRQYLNTEQVDTIHPDKRLTILFDPLAFAKAGNPGFLLGIMQDFPLFGNAICLGRNLTTYQVEELPEAFTHDYFGVHWYDPIASEECRKKSMQIGIDNYKS